MGHRLVRRRNQEQAPARIRIVYVFGRRADFVGAVAKRPNFSAHFLAIENDHRTHTLATPTNPQSELTANSHQWFRITNEIWACGGGRSSEKCVSVAHWNRPESDLASDACAVSAICGMPSRSATCLPARVSMYRGPARHPYPLFEFRALEKSLSISREKFQNGSHQ
jgi:hypothetical protein